MDEEKENRRGLNRILNNEKKKQHMALEKMRKKLSCSLIWKKALKFWSLCLLIYLKFPTCFEPFRRSQVFTVILMCNVVQ